MLPLIYLDKLQKFANLKLADISATELSPAELLVANLRDFDQHADELGYICIYIEEYNGCI